MDKNIILDDCIKHCRERQRDYEKYLDRGSEFPQLINGWKKQYAIYKVLEKIAMRYKNEEADNG